MGLFIFNKALISSRSARDGAADIDLFAAPVQNLANVTSTEGLVTLYFKDGNSFTAITGGTTNVRGYEYAQVELSVNVGGEQFVVRELGKALAEVDRGERSTITIDIPNNTIQLLEVTGINSIKRFNDLTTLTTDPSSGGKTYTISCVDGDNSDEEKIRLTDSDGTTDDVVLEAGTGMSIARSGDKITFTNTVSASDKWRIYGSSNVGTTSTRYIGIRGHYTDTSGLNLYTQAMMPEDCELVSLTCRIGVTNSATFTVQKNGTTSVYTTGSQSFTANTPQTFTPTGTSISQGDMINITVNGSANPGDVHLVMTFQAT